MSKHDAVQHGHEQACVEAFLTWLGQHKNACYAYKRAEDVFGREGQWEFMVRSTGGEEWIGIEVKSLVIQEWKAQPSGWDRFCRLLTKELRTLSYSQTMGAFILSTEVPWNFSQGQSKILRDAITQVLSSMAQDLPVGQEYDLTSPVVAKFPSWPSSSAMHNGRPVLASISVTKDAQQGCRVDLGWTMTSPSPMGPALDDALRRVFTPIGSDGCKASHQLTLAKRKGAHETILLLDSDQEPWKPTLVAQGLAALDPNTLANIDKVFLVSALDRSVSQVWP